MVRALLSLILAISLAVFGAIGAAQAHGLQGQTRTITVVANNSSVATCPDHERSQMSACGLCAAICNSATVAILPQGLLPMEQVGGLDSIALALNFSDHRTPPAQSPPRF
jgi:hypothetical protein